MTVDCVVVVDPADLGSNELHDAAASDPEFQALEVAYAVWEGCERRGDVAGAAVAWRRFGALDGRVYRRAAERVCRLEARRVAKRDRSEGDRRTSSQAGTRPRATHRHVGMSSSLGGLAADPDGEPPPALHPFIRALADLLLKDLYRS